MRFCHGTIGTSQITWIICWYRLTNVPQRLFHQDKQMISISHISVSRDQAISEIVTDLLAHLSLEDRESLLLSWWSIESDDDEYSKLPENLRDEISSSDDVPGNPKDPKYDPLLRIALEAKFVGVLNTYLEKRLSMLGCVADVVGEPALLERCPCCQYHSLPRRGQYNVCSVFFGRTTVLRTMKSGVLQIT